MSDTGPVVLVHPDLPGQQYETTPQHARVLAASGWAPMAADETPPADDTDDTDQAEPATPTSPPDAGAQFEEN